MQSRLLSSSKLNVPLRTPLFSLAFGLGLAAANGCVGGPIADGGQGEPAPNPGVATPDVEPDCAPASCEDSQCGLIPDGCGESVDCGAVAMTPRWRR